MPAIWLATCAPQKAAAHQGKAGCFLLALKQRPSSMRQRAPQGKAGFLARTAKRVLSVRGCAGRSAAVPATFRARRCPPLSAHSSSVPMAALTTAVYRNAPITPLSRPNYWRRFGDWQRPHRVELFVQCVCRDSGGWRQCGAGVECVTSNGHTQLAQARHTQGTQHTLSTHRAHAAHANTHTGRTSANGER